VRLVLIYCSVGGFAPNSEITLTWDGTAIPTVPDPIITDAYGDFTAIISVLTPNSVGNHVVNATDEIGNSAVATFHRNRHERTNGRDWSYRTSRSNRCNWSNWT